MKTSRHLLFVALAVFMAGCVTPRAKKGSEDKDAAAKKESADAQGVALPDVNVEEASLRGKDFQPIEGLAAVMFDYDSASLKGEQLDVLKKNAAYLKEHPSVEVLVAGFCDERGTTEYNLALGQKRAKEVRDYYIRLGVAGKSLATISYGKESPSCSERTEACWAANRRAETRVRLGVASAKPSADKPGQ